MDVLLGLDLGTTFCKAALYTVQGRLLGSHSAEYTLLTPRADWVEQNAEDWWTLACDTVRGALGSAQLDGRAVRALSLSTQGISFVPVDAAGNPLRRAITWLDTRARSEVDQIARRFDDATLFAVTGKRPAAFYLLPKLLWLREHEPDVYARTFKFLTAHDYLLYKLCGAALTDYSMAGGSLLLDVSRLEWSDRLLNAFELDRAQMPDLQWAGTCAGTILPQAARALGVNPDLPVIVGGQDQKCAALGAGIRPGRATVSLGTASAITALATKPELDPRRLIPTFPFLVPGHWALEAVVGTAGAALKWLRQTLFASSSFNELDEQARASPTGANGISFYPHLAGATSPLWASAARGAFTGLTLRSEAGDIWRSVLEGIAFQIRANLECIEALQPVNELMLFGGGASSALWCDMICQITQKPVYITATVDVANWGACLNAAAGIGLVPREFGASSRNMPQRAHVPQAAPGRRYQEIYEAYRERERDLLA